MTSPIDWKTEADLKTSRMVVPTAGEATWTGPGIIMRGPIAKLVRHVMAQSMADQTAYAIVLPGQAHIGRDQIAALMARPDFPHG